MSVSAPETIFGSVASLHLHPPKSGGPMQSALFLEVAADDGIAGNTRYFGRRSSKTGKPSQRQVTLIEREQIAEHAAALGLESIAPGAVRSNIETFGLRLAPLLGREIQIGTAVLYLAEARTPCSKMDDICPGLRELMGQDRQGVLAEVRKSGRIAPGDIISVLPPA